MSLMSKNVCRGIIKCSDMYLVCESLTSGNFFLPGGTIEPNEDADAALFRELKEECRLILSNIEFIGTLENKYHDGCVDICETNFIFYSLIPTMPESIRSEESYLKFHWINKSDIAAVPLVPRGIMKFFSDLK
jgi:8-oxo-dGTP pyrophosphatase MutT (NUDIX family)